MFNTTKGFDARATKAADAAIEKSVPFDQLHKADGPHDSTFGSSAHPESPSIAGVQGTLALRQVFYGLLSREVVEGLRKRRIDVESALFGEAAVGESLRDPRLLAGVFTAFSKSGGDDAIARVARKWHYPTWTASMHHSVPVQFEFESFEWIAHVETELTVNVLNGRRIANVLVRLATGGCLLRSDIDIQNRGEITTLLQALHHDRLFFDMTELGASVFRPIRDDMLKHLDATPGELGVAFSAVYCGIEDRIDLKYIDRRTPLLLRTIHVSFEPGSPADSGPRK